MAFFVGGGGMPIMGMGMGMGMMGGHPMLVGGGGMGGGFVLAGHPMLMGGRGGGMCTVTAGGPISARLLGVPIGTTVPMSQSQRLELEEACEREARRGPQTKEMGTRTLYHITDAGPQIDASGKMQRGTAGAYGGGIYFAGSPQACERKAHSKGWLITARVRLGTALVVQETGNHSHSSLRAKGCDSVYAPDGPQGGAAEYVVYNHGQVDVISVAAHSG